MSNHKRGTGTRIYNKFEHWKVADCDCTLCQHYAGKGNPCPLDECCIADIKIIVCVSLKNKREALV